MRDLRQRYTWVAIGFFFFSAFLVGCQPPGGAGQEANPNIQPKPWSGPGPIPIVCTTAQVADMLQEIAGPRATVSALMGPGVDPHLYKPTPGDVKLLNAAGAIFYSGLHLEGRLGDLLLQLARRRGNTFAVTEGLQTRNDSRLREPAEFEGHYDPHVWHDVSLWETCVLDTAERLATFDPAHADEYRARAQSYAGRLKDLHAWCKSELETIPASRRVLITAHDAFGYFGAAYGIEVHGLQGISTADEAKVAEMQKLVDLLVSRGIKAVFVESSVQPRHVEALVEACAARGHEIKVGGELFSDALGDPGTPEATYIGMIQHNVRTIVSALR